MDKLKCLLKRYRKISKKARKMYIEIMEAYQKAYLDNDIQITQEIFKSLYPNKFKLDKRIERALANSYYGFSPYKDNDSIRK